MLNMEFEPEVRKIVEVPAHPQILMYTATLPKEVRKIDADLLVNPVQVNIGIVDEPVAQVKILFCCFLPIYLLVFYFCLSFPVMRLLL